MKLTDRLKQLVGIGVLRNQPPPELLLVADGLVVTETRAIAWYEIETENTDTLSEAAADGLLDGLVAALPTVLDDKECHLKVVWGRIDGAQYLAELPHPTAWDDRRADWLDAYEVPDRHVLLGVVIDDNRQGDTAVAARRVARAAFGATPSRIPDRELQWLHGQVRRTGDTLRNTGITLGLATVETLAWMHSRELHRDTMLPNAGTLTGASLGRLTAGRVVPYPDHLVVLGDQGQPVAYTSVLALSDFPEQIETPGDQEWLRTLSDIVRVDSDGDTVPVQVDASVRFRFLAQGDARKRIDDARTLAKEQRQSAAKHSAGDPDDEIVETEDRMSEAKRATKREGLRLVEMHARLLVSAATRDELDACVAATQSHYDNLGITAYRAVDEQRDLWLECLPCDQLRVTDLGQTTDATAFLGSWAWGGSAVGLEPGHRMIGYLAGSTPGVVRNSLVAAAESADTTTTVYVGRSRRGKTTALMLGTLDAVVDGDCIAYYLSVKGDDLGIDAAAEVENVPHGLVGVGEEWSGSADLFRSLGPDAGQLAVHRQLQQLTPPTLYDLTDVELLQVVQRHGQQNPTPTTWGVIADLLAHPDERVRRLGGTFESMAGTPLGAPILGPYKGRDALPPTPGLWTVHFPGYELPGREKPVDQWTVQEKLLAALMRAFIVHAIQAAGSVESRGIKKLVAVPEVHRLIRTADGLDFLDQIARMGAALNTHLAIDLQDMTSLEEHPGLLEQVSTWFVFQLASDQQARAAARILDLPEETARETFRNLGKSRNPKERIQHGACLMQDPSMRTARVQIVLPDPQIAELLRTTPEADDGDADEFDGATHEEEYAA